MRYLPLETLRRITAPGLQAASRAQTARRPSAPTLMGLVGI
jgi:hypothetical protein